MKPNSIEVLRQNNIKKGQATIEAIDLALELLRSQGKKIDIKSVITTAGIARSTLYRYPELMNKIKQLSQELERPEEEKLKSKNIAFPKKSLKARVLKLENDNNTLKIQVEQYCQENRALRRQLDLLEHHITQVLPEKLSIELKIPVIVNHQFPGV